MMAQYPLVRWQAGQRAKPYLHATEPIGTWTATLCGHWVSGPAHGPALGSYGEPTCGACRRALRSRARRDRWYTERRPVAATERDG